MKFEDIKKLQQKKFREELGHFLIEGEHLVLELHKAAAHDARLRASEVYITREYANWASPLTTHLINARHMMMISETRSPQGIAAVVPLLAAPAPRAGERAIYLHEIQDPGNLGTILRTLAWFGGFRCLLSPDSVDVHNGKVVRASMGAVFHVPIEIDVALASLSARFGRIACLDLQGQSIASPEFRDFGCYIFGIDSLNVAATVNISQYELHRPL
jgi:TrmH family RNA methyltransferase